MSTQNLKIEGVKQAEPLTNAAAYYKVNYRYTSMQQLDKTSSESKWRCIWQNKHNLSLDDN
jgi:hypothetical protein